MVVKFEMYVACHMTERGGRLGVEKRDRDRESWREGERDRQMEKDIK